MRINESYYRSIGYRTSLCAWLLHWKAAYPPGHNGSCCSYRLCSPSTSPTSCCSAIRRMDILLWIYIWTSPSCRLDRNVTSTEAQTALIVCMYVCIRLYKWNPVLHLQQMKFNLFPFHQGNYIKVTNCQINLIHAFVYCCVFTNVFIKWSNTYGWKRNHILQDLTGL